MAPGLDDGHQADRSNGSSGATGPTPAAERRAAGRMPGRLVTAGPDEVRAYPDNGTNIIDRIAFTVQ